MLVVAVSRRECAMAPEDDNAPESGASSNEPAAGEHADETKVDRTSFERDHEEDQRRSCGSWDSKLLPRHRDLIVGSAISPEVALERGYRSITKKSELKVLGFGDKQYC